MRWDHVTNYMVPLAENVSTYSISADGRKVALLRSTRVAANGTALFNLDLLDLDTKQTSSLLKGIPQIRGILISPNARWIAFQEGGAKPSLYAISINKPDERKQLGICNSDDGYCETASWSPDSNSLLWEDNLGIWVSDLDRSNPTLITSPVYEVTDPKGQKSQISVTFQGMQWSPKGRYILSHIKTESGVCWFAVLDSRQGHWFEIPGTFQISNPQSASASWMNDGKIIVVNIINQLESPSALIDLWKVISTRNELLVLEKEIQLNNLRLPALSSSDTGKIRYFAGWTKQIQDQVICFVIASANGNQELYLYVVDIESEIPIFANQAQIRASDVLWPPDGSGALLLEGSKKIMFAPVDGKPPIQLEDLILKQAHDFTWAPPAPRL